MITSTTPDTATLRRQMVEVGRRMWTKGMVAANDGNLSARLPDGSVLCTPTGTSKGALTEDALSVVALDGTVLDRGTGRGPSSEIRMHLRVLQADPGVHAVVHAHPLHATAFAIRGEALTLQMMPETVVALPSVPLAPYATPSTDEVPDSVEPFVAAHRACLLEHHGALSWGSDLEDAFMTMERVEYQAQMTMTVRLLGGPRELSAERVGALRRQFGLA
ncbi:class II aldolase/adducin family protein [Cellulomonas fengjieae]|uniref:class II aldolase/adducin family protein n=1 Tax=Cellulomonas fengjieae TaxID=2819978 RepID=UPI001AAFEC4B|nr:class II aldolase/adducin family protein [Cellulomonas fengjieae]MBO3102181.1 class II aldolase/adducin family protein [Cellulomonas fengjieae]